LLGSGISRATAATLMLCSAPPLLLVGVMPWHRRPRPVVVLNADLNTIDHVA
jgi:hypothetical protein